MSIEVIVILLVALLAAGTLLAGRTGIRSIQRARRVVFYRTRRSYMLAGWQWLVLALVLLSSTVASAVFGEPVANQFLAASPEVGVVPPAGFPTSTATPLLATLNERTATPRNVLSSPSVTLTHAQTDTPSQTTPEPASVTSTKQATSTSIPSPTRTQLPTASSTITRTSIPSPTDNLNLLAT